MKKYPLIAFCLCLFLLALRSYDRLLYAQVWAEDGTRCLQAVSESGLASLFHFSDGYFYVLQKLLAFCLLKTLPIEFVPTGIALVMWVLTSLVFAQFSLDTFSWLVPSRFMRVVGCGLFCFAPGLHEVFGNLANLPAVLFFYICLVSLRDPSERLSPVTILSTGAAVFSSGTYIVLAPLFFFRFVRFPNKRGAAGILVFMCLATLGIFSQRVSTGVSLFEVIGEIPTILIPYVVRGLLFQPWFGDSVTSTLNEPHIKFWQGLVALVLVSSVSWIIWTRRKERGTLFFAFFLLCVSSWPLLAWINRPLSFPRFVGIPHLFWKDRYSFFLGTGSIIFWLWAMAPHRLRTVLLGSFVISQTVVNAYRFQLPRYTEEDLWGPRAAEIRMIERQRRCGRVPVQGIPREYDWFYIVNACK